MTSTSDSDYKKYSREFLNAVIKRPSMYFKSLDELHALMSGHQLAFEQLQLAKKGESFNRNFSEWLSTTTEESDGAAGWVYTIQKIAAKRSVDSTDAFFEMAAQFLGRWTDDC